MRRFLHRQLPWNVVFGSGAIKQLADAMDRLDLACAMVLTTPGRVDTGRDIASRIGAVGIFDGARMHVPAATVADAVTAARDANAGCTVAIGGGSTIGLGKALALEAGLPNVAIPTTYSGSEMTNIWGITGESGKRTGRDRNVLPDLALYDPELTLDLPVDVTVCSGMNALAQAIANVGNDDDDISALALDAVKTVSAELPRTVNHPHDLQARSELLWGACLAGAALGAGSTGLHHKLCHIFGGTLGTPHAETHAVLLPHTVAYAAVDDPETADRIAKAIGSSDAAIGLHGLARGIGAPTTIKGLGVKEDKLLGVLQALRDDGVDFDEPRLLTTLHNAFHGHAPSTAD